MQNDYLFRAEPQEEPATFQWKATKYVIEHDTTLAEDVSIMAFAKWLDEGGDKEEADNG